jgi:plasmid stabilization system protein ParE
MGNSLSISPRAESDLMEAFNWYEERSAGLGHEFFRCVEARLNLIARAPQLFRQRGSLHRMAKTDRFPYAIYFIWETTESHVAVRRVLHFSQNAEQALPKP